MKRLVLLTLPLLLLTGCTKEYNPLDAVSIEVTGYRETYKCGDAYSFEGEVKATYKDGTVRTLNSKEFEIDSSNFVPFSMNGADITISYGDNNFSYSITKEKRDSLKILMIGNSFSDDTETYLYPLATAYGLNSNNVKVADLYIGGCSIDTHVDNAKKDKKAYFSGMEKIIKENDLDTSYYEMKLEHPRLLGNFIFLTNFYIPLELFSYL